MGESRHEVAVIWEIPDKAFCWKNRPSDILGSPRSSLKPKKENRPWH